MTATATSARPTITAGMMRVRRILFTAPMVEHERADDGRKRPGSGHERAHARGPAPAHAIMRGGASSPDTTEAVRDPQPGLARGGLAAPGESAGRQARPPGGRAAGALVRRRGDRLRPSRGHT